MAATQDNQDMFGWELSNIHKQRIQLQILAPSFLGADGGFHRHQKSCFDLRAADSVYPSRTMTGEE